MSKITIEDISRHTKLSRGTVSRALNNRPDISLQTKQRVLEACRELNYVPSHAARSLATGRSYAVAVVVNDLRASFSSYFLRGVIARAQQDRYAVHVSELGADPRVAVDTLCSAVSERVDSILVATPLPEDLARQIVAASENRPLVACASLAGSTADVFVPDYRESGRLAAQRLLESGSRDVVYVHETGSSSADECLAGFREVCAERHLPVDQVVIEIPADGVDRLAPVRARLGGVRAAAATHDFLAIELMLLARELGRSPGRDIAIMGQGNELAGARISPTLTSVDYAGEEIGSRAMDIALQRVYKTREDPPQHTRVAPTVVERESTRLS